MLSLVLCIHFIHHPIEGKPISSAKNLGDYFYLEKKYQLAQIEYERISQASKNPPPEIKNKIGLSLLRQNKFQEASNWFDDSTFASRYLGLYSSLKLNHVPSALSIHQQMEANTTFSINQKFQARILAGSILLEKEQYEQASDYYIKIMTQTEDPQLIDTADRISHSIARYKKLDTKSDILAGLFSAVLPGSGQMYTEHIVDGSVALFFNTMFLGGAIALYDLESAADRPHHASIFAGIIGIAFYLSNILGAYKSAHRYNIYQKRKFHQQIRSEFFNIDYIEKTSGLNFSYNF